MPTTTHRVILKMMLRVHINSPYDFEGDFHFFRSITKTSENVVEHTSILQSFAHSLHKESVYLLMVLYSLMG